MISPLCVKYLLNPWVTIVTGFLLSSCENANQAFLVRNKRKPFGFLNRSIQGFYQK